MSEYQYYDFRTIDKPLTETEKKKVSALSSRAEVTSQSASFVYNYGDFRGDVEKLMKDIFDIMLYAANWGTRRLMFRLPATLVNKSILQRYCSGEEISLKTSGNNLIIDILFSPEDDSGWIDAEGWLDGMLDLRDELLNGDYRLMYLAWLKLIQEMTYWGDDVNEDEGEYSDNETARVLKSTEPPVPPGLGKLSKAQKYFVDFLDIDEALIAVAAMESTPLIEIPKIEYENIINRLTPDEQFDLLRRLSLGEANLSVILNRRLKELAGITQPGLTEIHSGKRKANELIKSAKQWKKRKTAERKRNAEAAKKKRIEKAHQNEQQYWQQIMSFIEEKNPTSYDSAVVLLNDLKELAIGKKEISGFNEQIKSIIRKYPGRSALVGRLRQLL